MILFIVKGGFNEEIHISIIYIICAIIGSFMILVFIEIIQLNFCGLSTMTKKNIEERARLDAVLNDDNDDEEDNNEINKEVNKKDNDNEEKKFSLKGYCFELKNLSISESNQVRPSDLDSFQ